MSEQQYTFLRDWNILYFERIGSTNDYLKANASTLPHKTLAYTTMQTQGKGRLGRSWMVEKGKSLCISVLLKNVDLSHARFLPMVCAVAESRALQEMGVGDVQIKWPNDILLEEKKISGILCESFIQNHQVHIVCGFGINLMQPQDFFDGQGLPYGSSVWALTGKELDINQLTAHLAHHIQDIYESVTERATGAFKEEYEKRCITLGRDVKVIIGQEEVAGKAIGINDEGELLCNIDGKLREIHSGEASVRGLYGYV